MQCPKCSSAMSAVTAAYGEEADRCESCGGIFFRKRTLALLQKWWVRWPRSATQSLDTWDASVGRRLDAIGNIPCPACAT
jgi:Zn-finger nucleic acid-binding protein